ncbi:unnamed protein product [Pseudo-nitzschia multistriata]|uniref:Uncharacterized protein n=1 Tax=Pseudo-nitzschia multistriata TaxID=183589 RepID=A0A448ZJD9_9STRA|nr:unnamed protein product [Pseudo-nitzschia multistriata]
MVLAPRQLAVAVLFLPGSLSLTNPRCQLQRRRHLASTASGPPRPLLALETAPSSHHGQASDNADADSKPDAIAEQEKKFKIVACTSTACSKKRQSLGLDPLSTFGALYSRAAATGVRVEEGPCIGSCKRAPCAAVEHDEYFGSVALEGMTSEEFESDAFLNIVTEEDADRVWSCVENAVKIMAAAEEDD